MQGACSAPRSGDHGQAEGGHPLRAVMWHFPAETGLREQHPGLAARKHGAWSLCLGDWARKSQRGSGMGAANPPGPPLPLGTVPAPTPGSDPCLRSTAAPQPRFSCQVHGCVPALRAKTEALCLPLPVGLITLSFEQLVSIWMVLEQLGQRYWGERGCGGQPGC